MRGSKKNVPVAVDAAGVMIRQIEWGDMNAALESFPGGTDTEPLFKGLSDDRSQCPHWGYVVSGRFLVRYAEHTETVSAGDAYYLSPGHTVLYEEPAELVEFSPAGEYQANLKVARVNMAAPRPASRRGSGDDAGSSTDGGGTPPPGCHPPRRG